MGKTFKDRISNIKERIEKKDSHELALILIAIAAILIVFIAFVMTLSGHKLKVSQEENVTTSVPSRAETLHNIVENININYTDLVTVSSAHSEQANIALGILGLSLSDVNDYAICIDPSVSKAYCVVILEPKEDTFDLCKSALIEYIDAKQRALETQDRDEYEKALNCHLTDHEGYLAMLMIPDFRQQAMEYIRDSIDLMYQGQEIGEFDAKAIAQWFEDRKKEQHNAQIEVTQ